MIYFLLLLLAIIISHIILLKRINKITKYQNFKSNILMRLILADNFISLEKASANMHEIDDGDYVRIRSEHKTQILEQIKKKINEAIDEELDNDSDWKDALSSLQAESSYPFYQIFDQEIIKRFNERNKETKR